jgi:hypothetical protein
MKKGDVVRVPAYAAVFLEIQFEIGLIIEMFVKDNTAWVLFPVAGKVYISLSSLEKIN